MKLQWLSILAPNKDGGLEHDACQWEGMLKLRRRLGEIKQYDYLMQFSSLFMFEVFDMFGYCTGFFHDGTGMVYVDVF
jgi:hypothetical protein